MSESAGRYRPVSHFRRLVIDLMHFTAKVPGVTLERHMELASLVAARRGSRAAMRRRRQKRPPPPAADDGCETPTATNNQDCGGCGNSCDNAKFNTQPACDQGLTAQKVCGCSTMFACELGDRPFSLRQSREKF